MSRERLAEWLWDRTEFAETHGGPGSWKHIPEKWREEYRDLADEAAAILSESESSGAREDK